MKFCLALTLLLGVSILRIHCSSAKKKCEEYQKQFQKSPPSTGGNNAQLGEFPHIVTLALFIDNFAVYRFVCGGVLISKRHVVTAAHCVATLHGPPKVVRLGVVSTPSETKTLDPTRDRNIKNYTIHPNYKRKEKIHNIGMVELENDVDFGDNVRPACLNAEGRLGNLVLTEWGKNDHERKIRLYKLNVVPDSNQKCNEKYLERFNKTVIDTQMCVTHNRTDTCQGNMGGPLQVPNGKLFDLVAIPSHGPMCGIVFPTVYTKIHDYLEWIESIISN